MPSQYYENHADELKSRMERYLKSGIPALQYRARCIKDLLEQEAMKDE